MPTITSIKPQKNKKRLNIYLDDKFGFGLDLESFVKFGLKVGQGISEEEIRKIVNESEFQKNYDKILKFGSLRPRSKKEYNDWLKKHKVHESLHAKLFNRLKYLDFINDKKFALWWIDELKVANKLLEKKKYRWEKLGDYEARIKKSQFLARNGFDWETIKKVLKVDYDD
uniref:Regulatory protein RecX n=1 Tax=uncultured Microgenomates bacterium Rifle_16ft_4_minimus_37836 TaxID=1665115 RepID=A0A0H4T8X0_9BACT|nr:recombination regulator RecX, regulatory protein [uncultured Microgenomates bacterium Rifle_16ft_4_minimus_37836]